MEDRMLIKIQRPNDTLPLYKASCNRWVRDSKNAIQYPKNSNRLTYEHNLLYVNHPDWNPQITETMNEIGTYISTYKPRLTLKKILTNTSIILIMPFVIPIVAFLTIKDKIIELYQKRKKIISHLL